MVHHPPCKTQQEQPPEHKRPCSHPKDVPFSPDFGPICERNHALHIHDQISKNSASLHHIRVLYTLT